MIHIIHYTTNDQVRLWNVETGICLAKLDGHKGKVGGDEDSIAVSVFADIFIEFDKYCNTRLSIRRQNPNNYSDTVTRALSREMALVSKIIFTTFPGVVGEPGERKAGKWGQVGCLLINFFRGHFRLLKPGTGRLGFGNFPQRLRF